jgi:hypothetical protein
MKKVLAKVMRQKHNGRSYYELLGEVLAREALKGKHAFVKEILDRMEGPANRVEAASAEPLKQVVFNIVEARPPTLAEEGREGVRVVDPEEPRC